MKSRILILVRRLDKGGAEMLESRLAVQLSRLGYETYLGAQYSKNVFEGEIRRGEWIQRGITDVLFMDSDKKLGLVRAIIRLIHWQKTYRFDVVISSNTGLATITFISRWFCEFTHMTAFHDYLTRARLESPRLMIWRWLLPWVDHAYAITEYVRSNMVSFVPALKTKTAVIYNSMGNSTAVDNGHDIREELKVDKQTKLLLYVGRLNYRKGLDIVIDYTAKHLCDWNALLLIVGESIASRNLDYGKMNYHAILQKKIDDAGASARVVFLGYRKDVFSLMRQVDVLMHLARHEGFGLILVEAFLARLPIVASDVGGIPEVLDQTNYPTFKISDEGGVVNETIKILQLSPEERKDYTLKAYQRLLFFTDERRARDVDEILRKILVNAGGT